MHELHPDTRPNQRLHLLDSPRLELGGAPVQVGTKKAFALLAYLAANPSGHDFSALSSLLWPESPRESARSLLRSAIHTLGTSLGSEQIVVDGETVRLVTDTGPWIDVRELRSLLDRCELHFHGSADGCERCLPIAEQAMSLYTGEFLRGYDSLVGGRFDEWVLRERQALTERFSSACDLVCRTLRSRGLVRNAAAAAKRWLSIDGSNQAALRELMRSLADSGERTAAIRYYERWAERHIALTGSDPDVRSTALIEELRDAEALEPAARLEPLAGNLPRPLSTFVGRTKDLGTVRRLIDTRRMVTLTGAGGVGKTRLAIEAASRAGLGFADGVWFCELANITEPDRIPRTVAGVFDLHEGKGRPTIDSLTMFLADHEMLLILDNCEHLVAACSDFAGSLLASCPGLRIVATSREPLGIHGEAVFPVMPLDLPALEPAPYGDAAATQPCDSVRLFLDRVRLSRPDFRLTPANGSDVTGICRILEGVPLAIEMAAATSNVLSVAGIRESLSKRFDILISRDRNATARHRDLDSAYAWSYDLLEPEQKQFLRKLSVFRGGFTLEAADRVCSVGGSTTFELVSALVDKSLLHINPGLTETRYTMLEPVRQFAWSRLSAQGDSDTVGERHGRYYLELAEVAAGHQHRHDEIEWFDRLEDERDNHRLSIQRSIAGGDSRTALRLCHALHRFWRLRGYANEGYDLAVAALRTADEHDALFARVQVAAGYLAGWNYHHDEAAALMRDGLGLLTQFADMRGTADALHYLGAAVRTNRPEEAARYQREALGLYRALDVPSGIAGCLVELATLGVRIPSGEPEDAAAMYLEAIRMFDAEGDRFGEAGAKYHQVRHLWALHRDVAMIRDAVDEVLELCRTTREWDAYAYVLAMKGTIALEEGRIDLADALFRQSLDTHCRHGNQLIGISNSLADHALARQSRGDISGAAMLLSVACRLRRELGFAPRSDYLGRLEELRELLGDGKYDETVEASRSVSESDAVRFAMTGSREMPT